MFFFLASPCKAMQNHLQIMINNHFQTQNVRIFSKVLHLDMSRSPGHFQGQSKTCPERHTLVSRPGSYLFLSPEIILCWCSRICVVGILLLLTNLSVLVQFGECSVSDSRWETRPTRKANPPQCSVPSLAIRDFV